MSAGETADTGVDIFDLSCPLSPATPVFPGDPEITLARLRTHSADSYEVTRICLGSHSGTHLDAPRHFFADAATLDEYPLDRLVGPGVVVDVRLPGTTKTGLEPVEGGGTGEPDLAVDNPKLAPRGSQPGLRAVGPRFVDAALLSARLREARIAPGSFILLWTEGACLSPEAASLLLETGASLVGTDASSLDPPATVSGSHPPDEPGATEEPESYLVHRLLLGRGVLIAEGLCNLDRLGPGPVTCVFLPLPIIGTDGAPVRAIAWR